jgi:hypothetical protein
MTVLEVLSVIRQAGGSVVVEAGDLRISAPAGVLTQDHKAVLAEHKAVLVRLLAQDHADDERLAIQQEAEPVPEPAAGEWDFPTPKPAWWSPDIGDEENAKVDEFMGYGDSGPPGYQYCYKCRGKGWQWFETSYRPRVTCARCGSFIGYARATAAALPGGGR